MAEKLLPEQSQPELRRDPITGEWVILAAGRSQRPHAPSPAPRPATKPGRAAAECPFCPGHEDQTPPEICADRQGKGAAWRVRAIPNKYPLLVSDAPHAGIERTISPDRRPALGTSEVIVDAPTHDKAPWELGVGQVEAMLKMYRSRITSLKNEGRTSYVHIIRNHGGGAASSLEHPHSQLFGLPFIPPSIDTELDGFVFAHPGEAGCILCDVIKDEIKKETQIVMATDAFVAFCPFASRLPYETWVVPRKHELRFEKCAGLDELAQVLTELLLRFQERLNDPPFNYWIHTYPLHGESRPYHWHMEILPRLTIPGGLELGAGVWVNIVDPEKAAARLR